MQFCNRTGLVNPAYWQCPGIGKVSSRRRQRKCELSEAESKTAFANTCIRLVILADASRFGIVSLARVAPLSAASALVTDRDPAAEYAALTRVPRNPVSDSHLEEHP